jgi:hypothetical protein
VTPALEAAKDALPAIRRFRESFDPHNRLINAWLDARTETDHLEGRTLKCVVVVEALIAMTTHADKTIAKPVRDPVAWEQLYDTIISVLPAEAAESLSLRMWQSLNAASFRDKLAAVCERHRITVPLADVAAFSQVRNAIVHRFDYDHRLRLPSQWGMEDHPQAAQHFFAADFVDRIILQLFGLDALLRSTDKT